MERERGGWRSRSLRAVVGLGATLAALSYAGCSDDDGAGSSAAESGNGLYEASCASCHGSDLRGTERGPSHLSQVYAADHHPDDSFRAAIEQGAIAHHWEFGDMPAIPGLSEDEVDDIIAFIRAQQDELGLEPFPPR